MNIKDISPTSAVAVAKYCLVALAMIAWLFNLIPLSKITALGFVLGQLLSAVGFHQAQDAKSPDPQGLEKKI